ncbi:2-oxo acid dehydrogenase subunit E2 [Streptomyces sp. NRRL F-525]|uniref:2-oxo acid dehydrogenase subunit E2 n=1 Tax=Streptomyces sp. NRRL F-525 TaxID=1463861 RepID=UPI000527F326|nr:2-oxo acid dehydrogenase subunit E2 [Streptomyces sp. NRRL F-525]
MNITPLARERRHTLFFLREIRSVMPVFLDTEVDLGTVLAHRELAGGEGDRFSVVSYVLHAASRALADHPQANAAIGGRLRQRVAGYPSVNVKLTLDKSLNGQRVVLAAVLPAVDTAGLREIQKLVEHYRDGSADTMAEFQGVRGMQRLPRPLGAALFRLGVRPLRRRAETFGTLAVTSLGHRPVDGFHSVGGTAVTLGVGRFIDRAVVKDGAIVVAPVLRLNMAFDHRVVDGAEAADLLADIKRNLEEFAA